ncbi:hypothetical protein EVA_19174 [gut metagenome]|uniref:Uncharacterized protein n=1 Tax=gut metagenome TaxID=749906 RepID=J9FE75_9ZZZZ
MEWPKELLELFDDPLLDDVRPKVSAPTPQDRMAQKLVEVSDWVEANGREPQRQGGDLEEKKMWAALNGLRKQTDKMTLKEYDRLNLLE